MASLKCDEHGEWGCSICFSSNPHWHSSKQDVGPITERTLRMAIRRIRTSRGVEDARRRNQCDD